MERRKMRKEHRKLSKAENGKEMGRRKPSQEENGKEMVRNMTSFTGEVKMRRKNEHK